MSAETSVPRAVPVRVILLDIEGTTTPVRFVKETLFPYARARLAQWITEHADEPETRAACEALALHCVAEDADLAATACRLADADQKLTALKTLQGLVWDAGYGDGSIIAPLYPDVAPALARWHADGVRLAIFSSGSIHAQHLLFAHTAEGDLTPLLSGYFDTTIGAKGDASSYAAIAAHLDVAPHELLFLSDIRAELLAARAAGVQAIGVARESDIAPPEPDAITHFDAIHVRAPVDDRI